MGVMAYPLRYALADLALALSRAADDAAEVRSTAARAAADMIGDGAGVQLLRDDGRYDAITYHHIDDERSAALGRVLDHVGRLPDDDFSTALAASRRPIVLAGDGVEPLAGGEHQIHAARALPGDRRQHVRRISGADPGDAGRVLLHRRGRAGPRHRRRAGPGLLERPGHGTAAGQRGALPPGARDDPRGRAAARPGRRGHVRQRADRRRPRPAPRPARRGLAARLPRRPGPEGADPAARRVPGRPLHGRRDPADAGRRLPAQRADEHDAADGRPRPVQRRGLHGHRHHRPHRRPRAQAPARPPAPARQPGPADRRHLARLQQPAHRGRRLGRHDPHARRRGRRRSTSWPRTSWRRSSTGRTLTHQLLAFGRSDGNRPEIIPIPDLLTDVQSLFSRTLGEHIGLDLAFGPGRVAGPGRARAAGAGAGQPGRERPRRDAARRHAAGRRHQRGARAGPAARGRAARPAWSTW